MKVAQEVLQVLQHVDCISHAALLPGQLDRKMYEKVNKVIELAGGKWNRKAKAHLFEGQAADALEQVLLTGEITDAKSELGAFDTPAALALAMVQAARIAPGMKVLEPSAGTGRLVFAAIAASAEVWAIEIDRKKADVLAATWPGGIGANRVGCQDFLQITPSPGGDFDVVLMNPPFAKRQDVHHIRRAAQHVKAGGRLVAIASASVTFRDDRIGSEFRIMVARHDGEITPLPAGSFKESGTMVNTVMVTMNF